MTARRTRQCSDGYSVHSDGKSIFRMSGFAEKSMTFTDNMNAFMMFIFSMHRVKTPVPSEGMCGGEWNSWNHMSLNEDRWQNMAIKSQTFVFLSLFCYHIMSVTVKSGTSPRCSCHRYGLSDAHVCVCMCGWNITAVLLLNQQAR